MIVLLELALYYYVWMNYYNRNMEVAFWRRGNWLIAGEYLSLLLLLHRMYGGLKIGIYKYWTEIHDRPEIVSVGQLLREAPVCGNDL